MKILIVLCLAVASASAFNWESRLQYVDIEPKLPFYNPENRITNGKTAVAGQFPYQVGLSIRVSALSSVWCGGSLIATNWILTAAHCTDGVSTITAYLGSTARTGGTAVSVLEIIQHSGFVEETVANDISLLRIPAVTLGTNIKVVPLPPVSNSYSTYLNDIAVTSGWGKTSDSGSVTSTLQYADLTIVSNTVCSNTYGSESVRPSNICIATPDRISTCSGDSGGPLVTKNGGVLIGITSYGALAGCTKGYPIAFTRVTSYRTWIKDRSGV